MNIVIKVGTHSILAADGTPYEPVMLHLVEQIASLQKDGHHIILVSSGAVGSGRKVALDLLSKSFGNSIGEKQLLASLGQHELMRIYCSLFKTHHLLISQILLSKHDFQTRYHYLNIARLLREILRHKNIIPIINENDSVAVEELMFTDNDELAGLIAAQINADKLIILTHVEGVYSGPPNHPDSQLISEIYPDKGWPMVSQEKSTQGRGGMLSKLQTARKMSALGITTHIASINTSFVIKRIVEQESVGTVIFPRKKKSNIKRWMAYTDDKLMGSICINQGLVEIIEEGKRVISILPVGIEQCSGAFKKSDLVEIVTRDGKKIGVGIAKYDVNKLSTFLGQKEKPEFIHYDHLHFYEH
jgi:glutamate 5-kinase